MSGERTRERELDPLRSINDNYEKVVLSIDRNYVSSYEGIKIKNIVDFLLEKRASLYIFSSLQLKIKVIIASCDACHPRSIVSYIALFQH